MLMCGIAGQVNFEEEGARLVQQTAAMQAALRHRGPDQEGLFCAPHAVLAHTRLCVIDRERGRQPMSAGPEGRVCTLVYNGELYNTEELRRDLAAAGWSFDGHSDTEVLLKAYLEWGEACPEKLNGIYAFAVWDAAQERLFLARDRMGVKPLFYTLPPNGGLLFASEIKGLLAHPDVRPQVDARGVGELLLLGPGRTPGCGVFRGICELRPGEQAVFDREGLHKRRYWQLKPETHRESEADTCAHVRALVKDAIRRQLVSDVPLGAFLSGGLDSSLLCAVAAPVLREQGRELVTFSVDYRENERYFTPGKFQPSGDNPYIARMTKALGCPHRAVVLEPEELTQALFEAVDARDLPGMADIDASLLLFCRAVRREVTVALSGECADEIFGGYPWFRDPSVRPENGFPWAQSTALRASFLTEEWAGRLGDAGAFVENHWRATLADTENGADDPEELRRSRQMMRLNMDWFMQTLLDRKDRMSMYSALEVRVPFCDHRLAEYLYNVPPQLRDLGGEEKGLLRRALGDLLPPEVAHRKKSPYPKTVHPAYRQAVSRRLRDLLLEPEAPLFRLVRREALAQLLERTDSQPWYGQLMTTPQTIAYFLQLDYWLRRYRMELC